MASRPTATTSRAASPALPVAESLTARRVEAALARFRGPIAQIPPMHAAIKVGGHKLYELARRGEEIPRRAAIGDVPSPRAARLDATDGHAARRLLERHLHPGPGARSGRERWARAPTSRISSGSAAGPFTSARPSRSTSWPRANCPGPGPGSPSTPMSRSSAGRRSCSMRTLPAAGDRARRLRPMTGIASGSMRAYDAAGDWLGTGDAEPGTAAWRPHKVVAAGSRRMSDVRATAGDDDGR